MRRLFLIGYMGAGKTTAGKELAKELELEFLDLDHYIERRYQTTVNQLFEKHGEEKFRTIESSLLKEVAEIENIVIATGGGSPCFFDNMDYMNRKGQTVYLKSAPDILAKRLILAKEKRPLIKDKDESELLLFIKEALAKRENFYNQSQVIFEMEDVNTREDVIRCVHQLITRLKV